MASIRWLMILAVAISLTGVAACGDDDGGDPDPMGDSGMDEPDAGSDEDAGPLEGQCGDDDQQGIDAYDGTEDGDFGEYSDQVAECGRGCVTDSDPETCTRECLADDPDGAGDAASAECEGCFVGVVMCAIQNCLSPCASDPSGQDCIDCRCGDNSAEVNCQEEFTTCSGIPSDTCD